MVETLKRFSPPASVDTYAYLFGVVYRCIGEYTDGVGPNGERLRQYGYSIAAPVIGYASPIFGTAALERTYDAQLTGLISLRPGDELLRKFRGQPYDPSDLHLSLDIELQRVAEEAFAGRRGGAVAIDPTNGDVLVFASLPSFDPNGFARGISRSEYVALTENPDQPLFNRVLRGTYPPGSTIKPLMALAGLEYDVINEVAKR